ncbi:urea ABC transporter permease subunit UrtC [Gibbsiella greigii]
MAIFSRMGMNPTRNTILLLLVVLGIILPLGLDIFRLNLIGKYLTYSFVAVGLVLCWGYGGILSLGQGIFFGVGGYAMAMFLKLEVSTPQLTAAQTTPGIPDFMDWSQITSLPLLWQPFHSLTVTILAILLLPALLAFLLGCAMFKRRVGGVYFTIITQALSAILTILIIGQQGYTGGINGITDLRTLLGWDIRTDHARYVLYYVTLCCLLVVVVLSGYLLRSKFGRLLMAVRDCEDRVRFSGYDVANIKTLVFCISAIFSSIGGALFTLQVGFMSPVFIGTVTSIEMVIFCAVGGRLSVLGAIIGALLVNAAKTSISESFPELWLFAMGVIFIVVVRFFPKGIAGIYQYYCSRLMSRNGKIISSNVVVIESIDSKNE